MATLWLHDDADGMEIAEAEMLPNKNQRQKDGVSKPIKYLNEDKKDLLMKLVSNQNNNSVQCARDIAEQVDLPEKTVYGFIIYQAHKARWVKSIVNKCQYNLLTFNFCI